MKNLLIASSAAPDQGSGIGNYAKELSEALVAAGHTIHYLSPPPKDKSWLEEHGITHASSDQYDDPIIRCRELVRYFKENEIHASINNDNPFLQSIASALSCPVIAIGHMDRKSIAALACYGWQWIDYIVAISYDMHRVFVDKYGVPVNKCPIIHNGVKDRSIIHRGINQNRILRVAYSGGFSRNKGADKVFRLIEQNASGLDKFELHWFGDCRPSTRNKLSSFSNVILYGRVARRKFLETLSNSDILLLPSRYEGCPMVMLEAMSFGVVPISSDGHGAMREIIEHGTNGYICSLENWPKQATQCLTDLIDNRDKLFEMKKSARQYFTNSLDINVVANKILKLCKNPTVNRHNKSNSLKILRWHRPLRADGVKAPLIDRFCIYFGFLRRKGSISYSSLLDT